MGYLGYWGKAQRSDDATGPAAANGDRCHLLAFHSLDVAAVGAELIDQAPGLIDRLSALSGFTRESLARVLPFHLALHDLGKFAEPFQDYRPDLVALLQGATRQQRGCAIRHDSLGYLLWREWARLRPAPQEGGLLTALFPVDLPSGQASHRDVGDVLQPWMAAVLGHHGKPPEEGRIPAPVFAVSADGAAASRTDAATFASAARSLLQPGILAATVDDLEELLRRSKRASWWLAGFTVLCDWLGSDSKYFPYCAQERPLADYWPDAREAAARAVRSSGLWRSKPRAFQGIGGLFPHIASNPSPLQAAVAEMDLGAGPRLYVLEDLTGSGKTEAALLLAHRLLAEGRGEGIYLALPTMATADAMHPRVAPVVDALLEGAPTYLLTHSGPRLEVRDTIAIAASSGAAAKGPESGGYGPAEQPTASAAASAWLADGRKKSLLADVGVGTIDQALMAVLQSRYAVLRLFGLHRHVLVVDEVHACDAYMLGILCRLLEVHAALGGSAILLSATLPRTQRDDLAAAFRKGLGMADAVTGAGSMDYPLLTAVDAGGVMERSVAPRPGVTRRIPVAALGTVESVVARVAGASSSNLCVCWVRNSVQDAVDAYRLVAATMGADRVTLFHARFALGDRLGIQAQVLRRFGLGGAASDRRGHVVIATQVVEQSLDIDFDVMISDLCPMDLLIQRAGRLQRHARHDVGRPPAVLEVLMPSWCDDPGEGWLGGPFRRTAAVYDDPGVLWRTARELVRRRALVLPEETRALIEAVYGPEAEVPPALVRRSVAAYGKDLAHASVARNAVLDLDLGYLRVGSDWSDEQYTPTRVGDPTTTVRLVRMGSDGPMAWRSDLGPRLQWPLSQVSVARRLVARGAPADRAAVKALEAVMPFVGDDTATVLLHEAAPGAWQGAAVAELHRGGRVEDVSVRVRYSPVLGLEVERGA